MEKDRAAERIVRGLNLIRGEAARLDSARSEGRSFEAKLALKTIREECLHLREFLHELEETGRLN